MKKATILKIFAFAAIAAISATNVSIEQKHFKASYAAFVKMKNFGKPALGDNEVIKLPCDYDGKECRYDAVLASGEKVTVIAVGLKYVAPDK